MEFSPAQLIARLQEGAVPAKAKAAVARGTLPLPPAAMIEALDILAGDPDPALRGQALESLDWIPSSVVRGLAASTSSPPELLERIARRFAENEPVLLEIARSAAATDATAAFLASLPLPGVLEAVGRQGERIERAPEITAALLANPLTPLGVVLAWQERDPRGGGAVAGGVGVEDADATADHHEFDEVLTEEVEEPDLRAAEAEAGPLTARQVSIYQLLKRLSMGQKVALAVKGNREVRGILIRDTNRMLCLKVLENPRISDTDIETYAKSTNVSEDVLRGIAGKKEWCKKYAVVKSLVFNPKTPLGVSLDFLKRLSLKDVEYLMKNRNVPETLRSAARRLHALKREANR